MISSGSSKPIAASAGTVQESANGAVVLLSASARRTISAVRAGPDNASVTVSGTLTVVPGGAEGSAAAARDGGVLSMLTVTRAVADAPAALVTVRSIA